MILLFLQLYNFFNALLTHMPQKPGIDVKDAIETGSLDSDISGEFFLYFVEIKIYMFNVMSRHMVSNFKGMYLKFF